MPGMTSYTLSKAGHRKLRCWPREEQFLHCQRPMYAPQKGVGAGDCTHSAGSVTIDTHLDAPVDCCLAILTTFLTPNKINGKKTIHSATSIQKPLSLRTSGNSLPMSGYRILIKPKINP